MAKEKKLNFDTLKERCDKLVGAHAQRNSMFAAMKNMLFMDWDDRPTDNWIKETMSPDPFNAVIGVVRLLISTEPVISIAADDTAPKARNDADVLEKALNAIWTKANDRGSWPVHYDVVLSAILFSEIALKIANMEENVRWAEVEGQDASELKEVAAQMPFVYEAQDPSNVYPEFGAFGLRSVLHRYLRPAWQVREFWGSKAGDIADENEYRNVEYSEYWNATWRGVWTKESSEPIYLEKHGLPFIPWSCNLVVGSTMFNKPEHQRIPLLYPVWKGKWWHRQNLEYTLLYSFMSMLINPTWVTVTQDGSGVAMDLTQPGGQVRLKPGESIIPLARQILSGDLQTAINIAEGKVGESLLPKVVFGQAPSGTMAYSSLNMLSQGGRLPLVPIEQMAGKALARAFKLTLRWIKRGGKALKLYNQGRLAELDPAIINEDHLDVTVKLKADIPQDRLQIANVISMLMNAKGPDGLPIISRDTAANFLGFMQPGDETEKILQELFIGEHLKAFVEKEAKRVSFGLETGEAPLETPEVPAGGQGFNPAMGGLPPVVAGGQGEVPLMIPGGPPMPDMGGK